MRKIECGKIKQKKLWNVEYRKKERSRIRKEDIKVGTREGKEDITVGTRVGKEDITVESGISKEDTR